MQKKTISYILLFAIYFFLMGSKTEATNRFFKRISIEQGLSQPKVNSILRDCNGILWVGTQQGLNRVDRNELKIYYHDDEKKSSISGNCIYNLNEDNLFNLWIATDGGLSLYNKEQDNFETILTERVQAIANVDGGVLFGGYTAIYFYDYNSKKIERLPLANKDQRPDVISRDYFITHLQAIGDSLFLASTIADGIFTYNIHSHAFTPFILNDVYPLQSILLDKESGFIYLSVFKDGLYKYSMSGNMIKHYTTKNSRLSNDIILDIKKHKGKIWIATDGGGIDILDIDAESFENIKHVPNDINSLPVNSITILYNDNDDNLWLGTVRDGISLLNETYIRTYKDAALGSNKGLSEKAVISLFEDNKGNLWIGTDGGGINKFDTKTELFTHHVSTYGDKIVSITDFRDNELLVSLYGKGVFVYNKSTEKYQPFIIIDDATNRDECFSGFVPFCYRVGEDKILILSKNAYIYHLSTRLFDKLTYTEGLANRHSLQLGYNDSERSFMIKGNTIYTLENKEQLIRKLLVVAENEYINSLCYDKSKNRLWIASTNGLKMYDINREKLEKIETNMFQRISHMQLDDDGRLWINASNLLFSYDTKTKVFMIWNDSDGFLANDILTSYVKTSKSNYIYMGGSNGLVKIDKNIHYEDDTSYMLSLQNVELNGNVYQGNSLSLSQRMEVPQNYGSFNIRVNLKEKDLFRRILFRYRIYNQSENNNSIIESYSSDLNLASLAPGEYDIYVSCMTRTGSWTEETYLAAFEVLPPWYKRTWFVFIVIVFVLSLLILTFVTLAKRQQQRLRWEMTLHKQKLNEDKIQFLTNINHELRTPLTLIYAPLKRLLENGDEGMKSSIQIKQIENVFRQVKHMKEVINWLLDYDKHTNNTDGLQLSLINLNELIGKITCDFEQEFSEKKVSVFLELDKQLTPIEVDEAKIRIVISNLLMNALKFSNPNTEVVVRSQLQNERIRIHIEDKGIGFENIDTEKLFTRFYQGNHNKKGTGIGLSYCKELVERHGGVIGIKDNEGGGAIVYFDLPCQMTKDNVVLPDFNELSYGSLHEDINFNAQLDLSAYKILIVDDNEEFRHYLESELKSFFKSVLKASDGAKALELLKNNQPDIVISDVMMPVMNGYELCKNVKEDINVSHIPVILLTAKSDGDSKKLGYKLGADYYLSKPFDIELLLSVIQNQLNAKELIRQKYQKELLPFAPEQATISNADEQFMYKLNKLVEDNYSDADFDVSTIVDKLAMSRASLYNKMKEITGLGINEYINKYRVSIACSLLEKTDLSIADIAFKTGFTSQRYFSTVFKQATNKTPSCFREDNK